MLSTRALAAMEAYGAKRLTVTSVTHTWTQKVGPTGRNVHGLFCERLQNVSANENGSMRTQVGYPTRTLCPILAAKSHDH